MRKKQGRAGEGKGENDRVEDEHRERAEYLQSRTMNEYTHISACTLWSVIQDNKK